MLTTEIHEFQACFKCVFFQDDFEHIPNIISLDHGIRFSVVFDDSKFAILEQKEDYRYLGN
jgi:hypothetical protein